MLDYLLSVLVFLQGAPTFTAPSMSDILSAATQLFNPFVAVIAIAIGVVLAGRLLREVVDMFR
jgi:hypothetical protein